jgi:ELWxxDGT repeat protein
VRVGAHVYFSGWDKGGNGLFKTDGTVEGTLALKRTLSASQLVAVGDSLYFTVDGSELWKSDGSVAGTTRVRAGLRGLEQLTSYQGALYFSADDPTHGKEPWVSDGSVDGTHMLADLAPEGDSSPQNFVGVGDTLFFNADDGSHGRELWALALTSPSAPDASVPPTPDAGEPNLDAAIPSATDAGSDSQVVGPSAPDGGANSPDSATAVPVNAPPDAGTPSAQQPSDASTGGRDAASNSKADASNTSVTSPKRASDGCSALSGPAASGSPVWSLLLGLLAVLRLVARRRDQR